MFKSIAIAAVAVAGLCIGLAPAPAHARNCGNYPGGVKMGQPIPGSCGVAWKSRSGGSNGTTTCTTFYIIEDNQWYAIYDKDPGKDQKQSFVTASWQTINTNGMEIWPVGVADYYAEGGAILYGTDGLPFPQTISCSVPVNGSPGPPLAMPVVAVMYTWSDGWY
jgi:hypothetical protein